MLGVIEIDQGGQGDTTEQGAAQVCLRETEANGNTGRKQGLGEEVAGEGTLQA